MADVHGWVRAQLEHGPGERVRFKRGQPAPDGRRASRSGSRRAPPSWSTLLAAMDTRRHLADLGRAAPGHVLPPPDGPGDGRPPLGRRRRRHRRRPWPWTAIDELLELFVARLSAERLADAHGTIHLHATDTDGEWLVTLETRRDHLRARVTPRATWPSAARPRDLLLWAWNRVPVDDRFEVFGDAAAARRVANGVVV